mgnify:CR=1 FL=1
MKTAFLSSFLLILLLSACGGSVQTPQAALTPTRAAPSPAVEALTLTPTSAPAPAPTARPTLTPTAALPPLRAVSLCPTGPSAPDRRPYRLLYLQDHDLWLQEEGQAARLVKNSGVIARFRRFAASGRIFYIQVDRYGREEIWSTSLEGAALRLTAPGRIKGSITTLGPLSPDGALLAFGVATGDLSSEIWVARADGSGSWPVVRGAELRAMLGPTAPPEAGAGAAPRLWRPGEEPVLIFEVYPLWNGDYAGVPAPDLRAVNAQTGQNVDSPFPAPPMFSPDGRLAALPGVDGLAFAGSDGSRPVPVGVDYFALEAGGSTLYPPLAWLSDSSGVLLAQFRRGEDPSAAASMTDLWRVPVDGSRAERLASFEADASSAGFSPGLTYFHYWRAVGPLSANLRELRIARLDPGGAVEEVIYDRQPLLNLLGWSPGERYFLYSVGISQGGSLMLGDLCGAPRRLGDNRYALHAWLDGERFVLYEMDEAAAAIRYFLGGVQGEIQPLIEVPLAPENFDIWLP